MKKKPIWRVYIIYNAPKDEDEHYVKRLHFKQLLIVIVCMQSVCKCHQVKAYY